MNVSQALAYLIRSGIAPTLYSNEYEFTHLKDSDEIKIYRNITDTKYKYSYKDFLTVFSCNEFTTTIQAKLHTWEQAHKHLLQGGSAKRKEWNGYWEYTETGVLLGMPDLSAAIMTRSNATTNDWILL